MKNSHHNKRKSCLPKPAFQLRLIAIFAGLCILALIGQTLLFGAHLTEYAGSMASGGAQFGDAVPGMMWRSALASLVLLLPALVLIGIRATFKFAGPLYRIERHLKSIAAGEQPGPCKLRESDDLQSLCEALNTALEIARAEGVRTPDEQEEHRKSA